MKTLFVRWLEKWQKRITQKEGAMPKKEPVEYKETIYRLMGKDEVGNLVNGARLPVKKIQKL